MAKKQEINWLVVGLLGLVVYMFINGGGMGTTGQATGVGDITINTCPEDITFKPLANKLGSPTTTANSVYMYVLEPRLGSVLLSTGSTVATNKDVEALIAWNDTTYYSKVLEDNTDCSDPFQPTIELAAVDTSMDVVVKNREGTVNSASNAQAISVEDTKDMDMEISTSSKLYFGNPDAECKNVIVFTYNKDYFDKVTVVDAKAGTKPKALVVATTDNYDAWELDKIGANDDLAFALELDSDDDNEPTAAHNISYAVYDCNFYIDEDTYAIDSGVEDEDQNIASLANFTGTIYIS